MIALIMGGKRLSGFYPNCAEGENPFSFRKGDYYTFENLGNMMEFVEYIKTEFSKKTYSDRAVKLSKNIKFEDLKGEDESKNKYFSHEGAIKEFLKK